MFSNKNLFNFVKKFLSIKLSMQKIALEEFNNNSQNNELQRDLLLDSQPKTKKPSMYNVLLLNDDYTPMEFVIMVLEKVFNKKQEEATQIMLHVHKNGIGVCGSYSYEVAETKVETVHGLAEQYEFPLLATMEEN